MATRFDAGEIRKHEFTKEGYFRAEAVFARDGILEYRTPDGQVRKELRTPEANKQALLDFGLKPVSLEHPSSLIDSSNAKEYSVGLTDSTVLYDKGGFVRGVITVLDSVAVDSIRNGKTLQISAGYKCNIDPTPGVWKGERYDAVQTDLEINHIALTQKGRAGDEVKICLDDSGDAVLFSEQPISKIIKKNMARVTIDSVTYDDIPENFAFVVSQQAKELETAKTRADSLESERVRALAQVAELEKTTSELEEERDRALGRADGYEEIANSAIPVLEEHGYSWNSDTAEFVADAAKGKSKSKSMTKEEEDEEEEDPEEEASETDEEEAEEDDEEAAKMSKGKKPWMKKTKKDSVSDILGAWKKAELLGIPGDRFDSDLDADEVRRMTLSELLPDTDISGYSPAWVEGLFDGMHLEALNSEDEGVDDRTDSVNLQDMVKIARTPRSPSSAQDERSQELSENWKKPLSLSR